MEVQSDHASANREGCVGYRRVVCGQGLVVNAVSANRIDGCLRAGQLVRRDSEIDVVVPPSV